MRVFLLGLLLSLAACQAPDTPADPVSSDTAALAMPSDTAVEARVAEATARLDASEAGRRVLAAIDAHGGLTTWYANGPLHFRYAYSRLGGGAPIDTEQTIDTFSSRAVHTLMRDAAGEPMDDGPRFGWTGTTAWVSDTTASLPTDARFWSLTPYYFVAMPFVLADPGVNLEMAGTMTFEGRPYDLVYVTFGEGTGDAPDDYYYLLLDPETNQVGGVRYIVSYPAFFPDGGFNPEKLMIYDGAQTVAGPEGAILLQEGFRSWAWTGDGIGAASAEGTVTDVAFQPDMPDEVFAMPAGAHPTSAL
ncbi:MAG: hypothetical protein AAFN13_00170 [Bacteroidota bacterium]